MLNNCENFAGSCTRFELLETFDRLEIPSATENRKAENREDQYAVTSIINGRGHFSDSRVVNYLCDGAAIAVAHQRFSCTDHWGRYI